MGGFHFICKADFIRGYSDFIALCAISLISDVLDAKHFSSLFAAGKKLHGGAAAASLPGRAEILLEKRGGNISSLFPNDYRFPFVAGLAKIQLF